MQTINNILRRILKKVNRDIERKKTLKCQLEQASLFIEKIIEKL